MDTARIADGPERALLRGWLLFAVGAAGIAGVLAVFVALARIPALHVLPTAQSFYVLLVGHVAFSLVIWLLGFVIVAALYTVGGLRPGHRLVARGGLWLATAGSAILLGAVAAGRGEVILSDYIPVLRTPGFFVGFGLFAAGITAAVLAFLSAACSGRHRAPSLPQYGMTSVAACVLISLLALVAGILTVGPRSYQAVLWGTGHALQYAYVGVMSVAWYLLAASGCHIAPVSARTARAAFLLYPLLALPIPFLYLRADPAGLPALRLLGIVISGLISVPALVHALLLTLSLLVALRTRGWGWMREAWARPQTRALLFSLFLYLLGGLLAPVGARGNLRVTAHYHAMLVGGVTLSLMGLAYHLLHAMGWGIRTPKVARVQPVLFGTGVFLTVMLLTWAGALGAPRKVYGLDYSTADWSGPMNLMGVGAALAALGGALFVVTVLRSLLPHRPVVRLAPVAEPVPELLP